MLSIHSLKILLHSDVNGWPHPVSLPFHLRLPDAHILQSLRGRHYNVIKMKVYCNLNLSFVNIKVGETFHHNPHGNSKCTVHVPCSGSWSQYRMLITGPSPGCQVLLPIMGCLVTRSHYYPGNVSLSLPSL